MPIPDNMLTMLRQAQRILLIAHVSPDGDTLGSAFALRLAFLSLGKAADVVCQDPLPGLYRRLTGAQALRLPDQSADAYDLALAVDVSDAARMGACAPLFEGARQRMVVDHHGTNTRFGQENWVEPDAAATGVLAY